MFKKKYKIKNLELWLGAAGLIYLFLLALVTFALIKLLLGVTVTSLNLQTTPSPPFARFELEKAIVHVSQ